MRSLVYRYGDLFSFGRALGQSDQELALPSGESVGDGEWVLAIFEIGERRRATAAAARGIDKGDGSFALGFERRDWERLQTFAEAKSEKLRAARPVTSSTAAYDSLPDVPITRLPEPAGASAASPGSPTSGPFEAPHRSNALVEDDTQVSRVSSTPASPRSSRESRASRPSGAQQASPPSLGPNLTPSGRFSTAPSARVLLVDDDADIRDVVGAMLEAVGLTVEPVTSAEEALERVRERHFDLLVLDWSLPGMTGLELCRQVRREPQFSGLPVLFLSAHSSSKDIVEAFASGADDYVSKPFRAPELGARIFGLLRRARLGQTIA